MKHILTIAALLISVNLNAQTFTQTISIPVCDTFDKVTIQVLSNEAPDNSTLDSLVIYYKMYSTKTGIYREGNKKIANDTALVNPLKTKILQGAAIGYAKKKDEQKTASVRRSGK